MPLAIWWHICRICTALTFVITNAVIELTTHTSKLLEILHVWLHGLLGKSVYDVQVCVTGRGERCERTSEDHGITSAGQFLLSFDLLILFPAVSPPLYLLLKRSLHCDSTFCMTGRTGNRASKAEPLLAAEAALCADVADAAPFHA